MPSAPTPTDDPTPARVVTRAGLDRPRPLAGPVLAIESSCDESAVAVLAPDGRVLADALRTQPEHGSHGGVVPEVAARAHLAVLPGMVRDTLARAGVAPASLGLVAATAGPGLIGGLLVGSALGKGIALAAGVPFRAVNHLEAHALSARLPAALGAGVAAPAFPLLLLLLSGGHCQCVAVGAVGEYRVLGATLDDAAGEAFDKVAKLLGLGWPGGPALERLAADGAPGTVVLPRPLRGRPGCDFSFSGLKTAVRTLVAREPDGALPFERAAAIARGFQDAVGDVLADRALNALRMMAAAGAPATTLVAAGGVAANASLRARLEATAAASAIPFRAPPLALCSDNAVMVGWAAIERWRAGPAPDGAGSDEAGPGGLAAAAQPRWPLAPTMAGTHPTSRP